MNNHEKKEMIGKESLKRHELRELSLNMEFSWPLYESGAVSIAKTHCCDSNWDGLHNIPYLIYELLRIGCSQAGPQAAVLKRNISLITFIVHRCFSAV